MGFCKSAECEEFFETVPQFERMIMGSGVKLFKYYLDISRDEQKKRLKARRDDPLKQWKISPIDSQAIKYWDAYSEARNEMFERTHSRQSPWTVVRADDKRQARINLIKNLLGRIEYDGRDESLLHADRTIVFSYDKKHVADGLIAP